MAEGLKILAVSDGRRGIENQALGLAEAVAARAGGVVDTLHAQPPTLISRLTGGAPPPPGPAPDLWIGCGRAALSAAKAHRQAWPDAFFVYVQDPKRDHARFDLIVPPEHDGLAGRNVFPILGSPNRVTPARLDEAAADFRERIAALPGPRAAVLIGGPSRRHRYDRATIKGLIDSLERLAASGASLMITASRRTPPALARGLSALAAHDSVWLWNGEGANPYFAFLAAADAAIVTADSTNMLTEAASAALPVLIAPIPGRHGKFARLYETLIARRHARFFSGELEIWDAPALNETAHAAEEVLRRL